MSPFDDAGAPLPDSFLTMLGFHRHLHELLLQHQEALLDRDLATARARIGELRRELSHHADGEDELFKEIFAHSDEVRGVPLDLFTGEHKHLREMLAQFEGATAALEADDPALKRRILELLDEEAVYKAFFVHHDERERNLLYPFLDQAAPRAERMRVIESLRPR